MSAPLPAADSSRDWLRYVAPPLVLHVLLCLGLYQYGFSNEQMKQLHSDGPSKLIAPYVKAFHMFGPLGVVRTYLRGEQDERLYLEYSKLLLVGRTDMHYVADRQNDPSVDVALPARAWPYRDVRIEYPPLAFLATLPPALVSFDYRAYRYAFAAYMLLLHWLNLWLAARLLGLPERTRPRTIGRVLYASLAFLFALGIVGVTRMDHLVVTATLLISSAFQRTQAESGRARVRWAALCGALAALGVMTKLVPGLAGLAAVALWLTSPGPERVRCVLACATAGASVLLALNLGLYAFAGDHYLDTYRYHSLRGVQLESLYAGALMLLRPFGLVMNVEESFGSTNLASAATALIKPLSLTLFALGAGYVLLARRYANDGRGAVLLTCSLLLLFMLTNRVFSPQYLIWIGAPLCVLAAERPKRADSTRALGLFLLAVFVSQLIFPRGYPLLKALHPLGILLLNARNLALLVFLVWLVHSSSRTRTDQLLR